MLRISGFVVAADVGIEHLTGFVAGNTAGDHVCAGILAVQIDREIGLGILASVRHNLLGNDKLRSGGAVYSGMGLSTDIIGSAILAYINALNKIVYEEA